MTELNGFIIIKKLGEGTFSTVYKVKRNYDKQNYAMKKIRIDKLN